MDLALVLVTLAAALRVGWLEWRVRTLEAAIDKFTAVVEEVAAEHPEDPQ